MVFLGQNPTDGPQSMMRNPVTLALGWSIFSLAGWWSSSTLARAPEGPAAQVEDDSTIDAEAKARAKRIDTLIAQLGADDFFARERAQQELAEIGYEAFDALSDAADNYDDIEIKLRAGYLVRMMRL